MKELSNGELIVIRDPKNPKNVFIYQFDSKDSAIVEDEIIPLHYKGKLNTDGCSVG
jgi:hypothetical protein